MLNAFYLAVGIVLLTFGGETLIRGSLAAARRLNVSPFLSGLVIVGFGTSAPELTVSVDAALNQRPDIAVGNVVGSNIGNILLILGVCAFITPLSVRPQVLLRDAGSGVIASILFILLVSGGTLWREGAAILLLVFFGYLFWAYLTERVHTAPSAELHQAEGEEFTVLPASLPAIGLAILAGLLLLIGGARIMLLGAVGLANSAGVSEAIIGLTVVAVGTSLPEFSVSIIAALRRHADVAVGNILGSNLFNLLGILGVSGLMQPLQVHSRIMQFDQWVMLGTALLLFIFLNTGKHLSRLEGAVLSIGYLVYLWLSFTVFGGVG